MVGWIGNWLGHTDEQESLDVNHYPKYPVWDDNQIGMTCATVSYYSTGVPMMGPMYRSYVEKEVEDPACPYCGNLSKRRDARGNCIACGGPRR